jgi:hypothetical protein
VAGQNDISINQWLDKLLAKGAYGFATEALQQEIPDYSDIAVKRALSRLSAKGKIVSLYKGYYLLLPPQYASKGILPPQLYLDAFMNCTTPHPCYQQSRVSNCPHYSPAPAFLTLLKKPWRYKIQSTIAKASRFISGCPTHAPNTPDLSHAVCIQNIILKRP